MRFTLVKDLKRDVLMVPLLWGLLFFWLLFLVLNILHTHHFIGLSIEAMRVTLLGDEANFIEPLSFASLLEYVHLEVFFSMMVSVTLAATFGRLCLRKRLKIVLAMLMMVAALIAPMALLFESMWLFLGTFYVWHGVAFVLIIVSMIKLVR